MVPCGYHKWCRQGPNSSYCCDRNQTIPDHPFDLDVVTEHATQIPLNQSLTTDNLQAIALGIGVGVGLPLTLLLIACILYIWRIHHRRELPPHPNAIELPEDCTGTFDFKMLEAFSHRGTELGTRPRPPAVEMSG